MSTPGGRAAAPASRPDGPPGPVADAIAELAELHSSDPAARSALHAVALTRFTLESFWTSDA